MTAAELCRERGWVAGDVLRGKLLNSIQITAVGVFSILVRQMRRLDSDITRWEGEDQWGFFVTVNGNQYTKLAHAPLDDTPPRKEWFE